MLVFHTHTCLLIACLHAQCMLAYPSLAYLHLHTLTLAYFALGCFRSSAYTVVEVSVCKCECRRVSVCSANVVEVSVCKCKCRSVSVQGIFRKNPSQCFREKTAMLRCQQVRMSIRCQVKQKSGLQLRRQGPNAPQPQQAVSAKAMANKEACGSWSVDPWHSRRAKGRPISTALCILFPLLH